MRRQDAIIQYFDTRKSGVLKATEVTYARRKLLQETPT